MFPLKCFRRLRLRIEAAHKRRLRAPRNNRATERWHHPFLNRKHFKMIQKNISNELASLPPEAQQQVADFVDFLKTRYAEMESKDKSDFSDAPFIGMWRDRDDMRDSASWVRNLRKSEWEFKNGQSSDH